MPNWIKINTISPINEKTIHSIIDNYHAKNENIIDELTKLNFNIKYEEIENSNIKKNEIVNLKVAILKNPTLKQLITKIEGQIRSSTDIVNYRHNKHTLRACPKFCVSIIHSELYLNEGEQKMTKKIKKEPDAIDKVVDYFLENIDNPQDLFKSNNIFQEFTKKLTERMLNAEIKDHLETDENHNKRNGNTQKTIIT